DVIESDKSTLLGEAVAKRFVELPFLFSVLFAAQPLSIQVHPNTPVQSNRGIEVATGKYVAFGDGDDEVYPTMYETL
ncbi:hypothetical protein O5154_29220, partial [Escherichia coli]|nr:hypothetical protein [Escherichia coli]